MNNIPENKRLTEELKREALRMTASCVRNTVIDDYHKGTVPQSKTGDYSDVKVVTPYGEIAWNELSRISDDEMMAFNKEVTDLIYTYLQCLLNPYFDRKLKDEFMLYANVCYPSKWDEPEIFSL
ncbi:hypothetical protein [Bizionia sp.]|uniref:hypothetical protein n=1 Tax=Bizionia sp. TaxID=1954480 RepID=UPI003A94CD72